MAGKKNAKGGDPEVMPAFKGAAAGGENSVEEASAAVENPAEEVSADADPQEMETSAEETAEELETKEMTAEDQDIFSDEITLEECLLAERMQTQQEDPTVRQEEIRKEESQEEKYQKDVQEPAQKNKCFRITCRNAVSEVIGGVMFVAGVGYTRNAYAASWFANKAGYRVDQEE